MMCGIVTHTLVYRGRIYMFIFNRFQLLQHSLLINYSPLTGEPGKLIRERYRTASQVVQNQVRSFTTLTVGICMYGDLKLIELLYVIHTMLFIVLLLQLMHWSHNLLFCSGTLTNYMLQEP